jgi:hypothetical protein
VAAGGNGTRVSSDDDGVTFVSRGSYISGHFRDVAAGNGAVVAVGHGYGAQDGQGLRATSLGGVQWEPEVLGGSPLRGVAFANGVFVIVGDNGLCMRGVDGTTWTDCTVVAESLTSIRTLDNAFLVTTKSGDAYRSTDGISFDRVNATSALSDLLVFGNGTYVGANWTSLHAATALEGPYASVYSMPPGIADLVFGYRTTQ